MSLWADALAGSWLGAPPDTLAWAAPVVALAYAIFGMAGFGSAVIATPLLTQGIALHTAVPAMLLLDMSASLVMGGSNRRLISAPELRRLLPWMVVGIVFGVTTLVHAPERWLLLLLGVFVAAYASWKLVHAPGLHRQIATGWAAPVGVVGGVFTALFGIGGPIYTIYVAGRVRDPQVLRATMATVVLLGGCVRLPSFWLAGLYGSGEALRLTAWLLPSMLIGLYVGGHLYRRVPAARIVQFIWVLLVCSGLGLVWRNA